MAKKSSGKPGKQVAPPKRRTDAQLRAALTDEMPDIRAVDALIQLNARGGPQLTGLLTDLASNSDDVDLRATAAHALGAKASARHRDVLRSVVDDPEPEVARRAAESLGRIGGEVELKKLRAIRPKDPVVKRAVETAKTLLAYRTGATRGRLQTPEENEMLALAEMKTREVAVRTVGPDDLAAIDDHLKKILPQLPLAPAGHTIECGKNQFVAVWHRDLTRKGLKPLLGKSMIAGALLRRTQVDGTLYLDGYVLAQPSGGSVQLFVMRHSGEVSHCGELTPGKDGAEFSIKAVNTRHSKPIDLAGSIAYGTLDVTVENARVATKRSRTQPLAKKPRHLATPI